MDFDAALTAFAAGPWGAVTTGRYAGSGICQRSSLALLTFLEQHGLAGGVRVVRFRRGRPEADRDPHGNHWVLERDGQAVDVTAVQFDGRPGIRRYPIDDEASRWEESDVIDPDNPPQDELPDAFTGTHGIVPHWRDLLPAGPPGEIDGWPYFRGNLHEDSPWRDGQSGEGGIRTLGRG